jgi:hypothetical protein
MTYDADDLPMHLRWPGARRTVEHQREKLRTFDNLESSMTNLWDYCRSVRDSASGNRRRFPIDGDHLQQVFDACERGFLAQTPEGNRVQLGMKAMNSTNDYLSNMLDDLGDFAVIAHLEIGLRVLIHLALESARNAYEPDCRLPAWNQAIRDAASRTDMTVDAWRTFAQENMGVGSHGD